MEDENQPHKSFPLASQNTSARAQKAENRGTDGEPHWVIEVDMMAKSLQGTVKISQGEKAETGVT